MSSTPSVWVLVTVPAGKRAVIMTWTAANFDTVVAHGYARIGAYYPVARPVPVADSVQLTDLRLVAYAGEEVGILNVGPNMHSVLTGYLFDDTHGGAELERHYERALHLGALPADSIDHLELAA